MGTLGSIDSASRTSGRGSTTDPDVPQGRPLREFEREPTMTPAEREVFIDPELREYLAGIPDVAIVAECANGFEAVKAVAELKPDLLILDVQMPKLNGFEVLELVGRDVAVVFVTAFDQYAVKAFDVNAIDYLLKPFDKARVLQALERARQRLQEVQTHEESAAKHGDLADVGEGISLSSLKQFLGGARERFTGGDAKLLFH